MRIRLRQLSFASQAKACGVAGTWAGLVLWLVLLGLHAAGVPLTTRAYSAPVMAITLLACSFILAAGFVLLQILGLAALRLIGWRGPALEVAEETGLSRLFE
jgi:hypothetical protein